MTVEFKIPKSGMGITEGTILKWLRAEGDAFTKGEVIVEIETAKAVEELEAPFNGTVQKILLQEDEEAEVLTTIALIEEV
jgi:pyruvate/2-oxoglutarate dehydrogenase complex dihydrolipoamide acyltransferase (E2) component